MFRRATLGSQRVPSEAASLASQDKETGAKTGTAISARIGARQGGRPPGPSWLILRGARVSAGYLTCYIVLIQIEESFQCAVLPLAMPSSKVIRLFPP